MGEHEHCAVDLLGMANAPSNPMHGIAGLIDVTEEVVPPVIAVEFPPQGVTCPHGVHFWAYPNQERIDALRAMNAASSIPSANPTEEDR